MSKRIVVGVDEAGRGPLAGDVFAAAVVLCPQHPIDGLNDSKKLTERRRNVLFDEIVGRSKYWCIARATAAEIDRLNILQASLLAMHRAVEGLKCQFDFVYVDGNRLPIWPYASEAVIQGDSLVKEISAASILAKVARDREMIALDKKYPGYGFAQHKGYPTKMHMDALRILGTTPIHRHSFAPVRAAVSQPSLF